MENDDSGRIICEDYGVFRLEICWIGNAWTGLALVVPRLYYGAENLGYFAYGIIFTWLLAIWLAYYYVRFQRYSYLVLSNEICAKDIMGCMRACIELTRLLFPDENRETEYLWWGKQALKTLL